ncbi:hypothetical protein BDQ17DRAFT_1294509 [Cyathus striatus]|nr:hypothetical protein BDQ17DRAFT_1294509 [Cyathus striatus]
MLPGQYPSMGPAPGFYGNFLHHHSMANPQLPPLSSLDFPWPQNLPLQQAAPSHFEAHSPSTSAALASMHFGSTQYNPLPPLPDTNRDRQGSHSQPPAASPVSTDADPVDTERNAISEEKRRRNTAASARFRVKKKQKTINLERSVADLTGRAEELEKEVADLRRENGWLKEIVMLKGTRFAAANMSNRLALDQAAALALAGGPPSAEAGPSNSGQHVKTSEEDSEESSGKEEDPRKSRPKSRK